MVHADTILESLVSACKDSPFLPGAVTYSTIVLDSGGDHSNVQPPVIEFSVELLEKDQSRNTEKVGVETDGGVKIGYIYDEWFDLRIVAEVLTVAGTNYTHRELSQQLRKTLYQFDTHGMAHPLPDPDTVNDTLDGISWVFLDTIEPDNDFALSPSIRTRQLSFQVGFTHQFRTSEFDIDHTVLDTIEIEIDANLVEVGGEDEDGGEEYEVEYDLVS